MPDESESPLVVALPAVKNDSRDVAFEALKPAYEWVGRRVPRSVTPNQLTLAGFFCSVLAAAILLGWRSNEACFVAGGLLFLYETFDALDGMHARNTGQGSLFGAYLDAAVDAAQAAFFLFALLVRYELYAPIYIFALGFRMVLACLIHAYTVESRIRINPQFGSTAENYMIVGTLFAAGLFPGRLDLLSIVGRNGPFAEFLTSQKLASIGFIQAGLLGGLAIMILLAWSLVREARRTLDA
jgi:phosphatidylglycerophosphate synthase